MAQAKIKYITIGVIAAVDNYIDSIPGSINFSSDPEIIGDVAAIVITPRIEFSTPIIEIDGSFLKVTPPPCEVEFSSSGIVAAGFSGIVEVTPPTIEFSSSVVPMLLETMISVLPSGIDFSSPNIELDWSQLTFFSEPAHFKIASFNLHQYVVSVSSVGLYSIIPVDPDIRFSSPNIEIAGFKTIVTPLPGAIIFSGAQTPDNQSHSILVPIGNIEFSSQYVSIVGIFRGVYGIDAELPSFEMGWFGGAAIEEALPALTLSGQMLSEKLGRVKGTLPIFQIVFESGGQLSIEIPNIGLELDGTSTEALQTIAADISGILPMLQARMTGIRAGDNDLDLELDMFEVVMESGDCSEIVLRYVRGDIR